jgi:hypothetical protein
MKHLAFLVLLVSLLWPSLALAAQGPERGCTAFGRVVDTREQPVAGAPVAGLEVRLGTAAATIRGRIQGLAFEALAGLDVYAVRSDDSWGIKGKWRGRSDFEGGYAIEGIAPGYWTVTARSGSAWTQGFVTVPEGAAEVILDLEFGSFTLSGRVLSAGEPVPGLSIVVNRTGAASHPHGSKGSPGVQGEFRLEGLKAGTYRLMVSDFKGIRHAEELEVDGDREIVVKLPTQRVSGRVVDAVDSSPVEGASVGLFFDLPRSFEGSEWQHFVGPLNGETGETDPSGAFSLANVAEGPWVVVASKEGYSPAQAKVEVTSGADVEGVRLALSPGAGLVLEVRSASGSIPPQIFAALVDAGGGIHSSGSLYETGEGGRVRLGSVPAGRFRLYVAAAGTATVSVDVTVPGEPVQVVLPPASRIVVEVPDLAGQGGRATLSVTGEDGQPFRPVLDGVRGTTEWPLLDGRSVVEGVPPGTWRVRVTAADGRVWEGTATTTGGTTEVVLEE